MFGKTYQQPNTWGFQSPTRENLWQPCLTYDIIVNHDKKWAQMLNESRALVCKHFSLQPMCGLISVGAAECWPRPLGGSANVNIEECKTRGLDNINAGELERKFV